MKDILATYYAIYSPEEVIIEGKSGFKYEEYIYFTILATNNKVIHMEQTTLAYYLAENAYPQTAFPIPNIYGDWITNDQGTDYLVVKVATLQGESQEKHGALLAQFHQYSRAYHYKPQYISSYGEWKKLWIDKCTVFEQKVATASKTHTNEYYRLLVDVLPYIIGMSENAIQYIQETELESGHNLSDQGTISFQRYDDHLLNPIIWQTDLVYDHMTRDLAEYIRRAFLRNEKQSQKDVWRFLQEYQSVQPLTTFSWRLLYARLIFPIHLYDCMEEAFEIQEFEKSYHQLVNLLNKQINYEQHLRVFFQEMISNHENSRIPMLQWLSYN